MDSTTIIWIVGAIVGIGAGGYFAYNHFKKKNLDKLFNQLYVTVRQVPKKKKNAFILLMLKETMSPSNYKKKQKSNVDRLQNPKYLEVQMMQMSRVLKDTSKVEDKATKRALALMNEYLTWEKEKNAENKRKKEENKAA
ncbi:hypothetical protein [Fusibacter sp. JL216-2]|uniref:hypothetical protein n=1 Tax=Fusibacter sp. JL216-2 TaxID=3071453 RepID=UPI003D33EE24